MRKFTVFDLGETLIDYHLNGLWYESLKKEVIPLMFQSLVDSNQYLQQKISFSEFQEIAYICISDKTIYDRSVKFEIRIREYFKRLNIPQDNYLINSQIESFYNIIKDKVELYDDVIPNLEKLIQSGYKLGLFSNTPWECPGYLMERIMKEKKIIDYFTIRLFSGDIEKRKPDPQVFEILLSFSHESKSNMVYIGDRDVDIKVSHNFGIPSIYLNRTGKELDNNCPKPAFTIKRLDELHDILSIIQ